MNNKLKKFLFISICIIIASSVNLSGCDLNSVFFEESPTPLVQYNEEDYVFDFYDDYDSSEDTIFITQEEALSDYYEMWNLLEENYPFFGVASRMYGVDKNEVKFYYEIIIKRFEPMPVSLFHYIINDCLYEFKGLGHLNTIYPEEYLFYCDAYSDEEDGTKLYPMQYDTLHNERVEYVYEELMPPDARENFDEYLWSIENGDSANVEFKLLSNTTAYMKILSFEYNYNDVDYEKIMKFYRDINGYKNLIIDLTENGGGSDAYWVDNIVAPNIDSSLETTDYSMAKGGSLNKKYFESLEMMDFKTPKKEVSGFESLNKEDFSHMDMVFSWLVGVDPAGKKKMFDGKIYILMNENVYSASESLVMFCKKTGFATLVGTNSGGDGGGIDPVLANLKNSGMLLRYSPLYTMNPDGSNSEEYGTEPDYLCNEGEEPIDACKRAIDQGFYVNAAAYKAS